MVLKFLTSETVKERWKANSCMPPIGVTVLDDSGSE